MVTQGDECQHNTGFAITAICFERAEWEKEPHIYLGIKCVACGKEFEEEDCSRWDKEYCYCKKLDRFPDSDECLCVNFLYRGKRAIPVRGVKSVKAQIKELKKKWWESKPKK